ncbi:transcriptional regulator [Brucella sp. IR073]|uniref:HVO_A0114 family putative DNA-binding protein n=1 Tax=unclassified Brucella TaxID=2632610 RepID=UPI003B97F45D
MKTLRIRVESFEEVIAQTIRAVKAGVEAKEALYTFLTYEDLHRTLTPKRIDILNAMKGKGALSMREVARLVGRDFKGVHTDLDAMRTCGLIDRAPEGGVILPYNEVRIDITLAARAA